jgi:23S rRNA pseudouridine2605 synthase
MRLNVFISKSGYASRRKADILIKEGKVSVNGKVVRQPFFDVGETDHVAVGAADLQPLQKFTYIIFNKPKGVTTTRQDKFASSKVIDFLPKELKSLYPAGRLDKDSSGLIILTNDGQFCYQLTHPKFEVEKEYLVLLNGRIKLQDCKAAKKGIVDKGELLKVKQVIILKERADEYLCKVIVCEGKKRHIRRLFRRLGFEVQALKRVRIGGLVLGELQEGKFKQLKREKMYSSAFKKGS